MCASVHKCMLVQERPALKWCCCCLNLVHHNCTALTCTFAPAKKYFSWLLLTLTCVVAWAEHDTEVWKQWESPHICSQFSSSGPWFFLVLLNQSMRWFNWPGRSSTSHVRTFTSLTHVLELVLHWLYFTILYCTVQSFQRRLFSVSVHSMLGGLVPLWDGGTLAEPEYFLAVATGWVHDSHWRSNK